MRRDEAIAKLKGTEAAIRALGATSLYLYGSTARDEARPNSDVDVFVEYTPGRFTIVELAGVKNVIEGTLSRAAHVTTRNSLHPLMRKGIEGDAIRIF